MTAWKSEKEQYFTQKGLDNKPLLRYNEGTKTKGDNTMREKIIMIISILAFAISWGTIILAAILEVI